LFVQLYHKLRLIKALPVNGSKPLPNGVKFPRCSSKQQRKIGNNKVVLKAIDLITDYCKGPLFIALIPNDISTADEFYQNTLKDYKPEGFQGWDV